MIKKKFCCVLIILFFKISLPSDQDLILLDEVVALRISESGINPVFASDCWFLNPFFGPKSIEQCVVEAALLSYANDHSMKKISDGAYKEYAEEYFDMLLAQKKISKDKIIEILQEYGSNIGEMRVLLNNQFIIQQSLEMFFAASGVLHVSDEDILQYYHCMNKDDRSIFELQIGELLSNSDSYDLGKITSLQNEIIWADSYQVKKKDLKKSLYICQEAQPNEIFYADYDPARKIYTVYKLIQYIEGQPITLAEVYDEISRKIQMIKYEDNYKKMIHGLMNADNIIYFDLDIKNKVNKYIE